MCHHNSIASDEAASLNGIEKADLRRNKRLLLIISTMHGGG
jgi:hypothetical protein